MALTVVASGSDTLLINNQVISTWANQDPFKLTLPNELVTIESGKNGVVVYAENKQGLLADTITRLALGAIDDVYLNGLLNQQMSPHGFSSSPSITATFTKRVGDANGNIRNVIYQLLGGKFLRGVDTLTSAHGNTEEAVSVWHIKFGNWLRLVQ